MLETGAEFLSKPYTPATLARKVREVLDQPNAANSDPAQKTFGFTKISDKVKTTGN
jgi:DNA-binding response OmpR family regulator